MFPLSVCFPAHLRIRGIDAAENYLCGALTYPGIPLGIPLSPLGP